MRTKMRSGLLAHRQAANLSQDQLAKLARIYSPRVRVTQPQISRIERRLVQRVGFPVLNAIAKALRRVGRHVAPEDLL